MRIGVLGSGDVGRVLGAGLAARGHEVKLGTREPGGDKARQWLAEAGTKASAGTFEEAAKFAELAILATAWSGTENAIRLAGPSNLTGKVVIDATNPLAMGPGGLSLAVGWSDSAGEQVQRWLPGARVVKAFNTVGNAHMVDPQFPGGPPDLFICGSDEAAKKKVGEIAAALGWPPVIDLGGIESSRYLEPLAMAWIVHAMRTKSYGHAFKLLRK
ncbi:MAG TPA: NAD(P)-binding domain-containing protein [Candidatus Eisenbacteria bacterium]|jgi:predicted dinucleotide-binding enzyme